MSLAPSLPAATPQPELRPGPIPVREPHPASRVDLPEAALPAARRPGTSTSSPSLTLPWERRRPDESLELLLSPVTAAVPADRAGAVYPEPGAWASRFVLATLEVTHGVRPVSELVRWTTPEVHEVVARRGALARRRRAMGPAEPAGLVSGGIRLRAVTLCRPGPHTCEVAIVVDDRGRVRAVALRLEGVGTRWRVTALQIG